VMEPLPIPPIPAWERKTFEWSVLPVLIFLFALLIVGDERLSIMALAVLIGLLLSVVPAYRLLLLILLMPFSHAGLGFGALKGFGVYDIYSLVFILIFVGRVVALRDMGSLHDGAVWIPFVMLAAFIPSLINTASLSVSVVALIQFIVSVLVFAGVYATSRTIRPELWVIPLVRVMVVEAAVLGLFGIYQAYTSSSILNVLSGRTYLELFGEVNYYAGYLLMMLCLAVGLMVFEKGWLRTSVFAGSAAAIMIALVATVSRSALLGTLVAIIGFALYMLLQSGRMRWYGIVVVSFLALIVGVLAFTSLGESVVDVFTLTQRVETVVAGRDRSLEQRQVILEVAGRMVAAHPAAGIGFGAFEDAFSRYQQGALIAGSARSAHNTAVRLLAETGVIGLTPGLIFILILLGRTGHAVMRVSDERLRGILFSMGLALACFLLMSLTLDQLYEAHFWIIAGLTLALVSASGSKNQGSVS